VSVRRLTVDVFEDAERPADFQATAAVTVSLGSFMVLTDPNFLHRGQRASLGKGLWSRRLTESALQLA
jgi:hypothetical protein